MKIALIGSGRLATQLGMAMKAAGHDVLQVYSRTEANARSLALLLQTTYTTSLTSVTHDAQLYVVALTDAVLEDALATLCPDRKDKVFVHTAGSMPMDVFAGKTVHYGVFYPMQTFSKERNVDFSKIPVFVEYQDSIAKTCIEDLAFSLSTHVYNLTSEGRRHLHLSAVFACNFVNHCYALAADILQQHNLPFDVLLPLIDETAEKVHQLHPDMAQTGPAIRFDRNVIDKQLQLLPPSSNARSIYECMSKSIHEKYTRND